ncbi:MAG TPA: GAF domain-containing protein [Verrucomicrobiae bacterium]|nr:GAF domain-containing protein [Verrucomicrobiae bacterium]
MKMPGAGGRLFRKYVVVLLVLVGGVLMASSLVELYFSYRETQRSIVRVERAKAVAAAVGIEQVLKEIEQQVRETTRTASDDPDASQVGQGRLGFRQGLGAALAEQRELDFLRVLRNVPAVSELSHLDLSGKEQLRVSRLEPDVVGSQEDFSKAPKFLEARGGKTYWSPVYFKNETEPYVTLAVPLGKYALEVTTAQISLGAVLKAVSQIEVGPGGYAYVVDSQNQLVAHPDGRLLRERRDVSGLVQVKSARADRPGLAADAPAAMVADGLGGGRVLAAHAAIAPLGWLVFVERPAADAYAPLRAPIIRSVVIFVLGLGLSILASLFLARRMVAPIRVLQEGAARIGAGTLDQPIELHTGDEIETLAASFNRMTASLKESYEGLEQKVEARTRELADANRDLTVALEQQTATSEILRVISQSPTDVQPVFDTIVRSAVRLCDGLYGTAHRFDGELVHLTAHHNCAPEALEALRRAFPMRPDRHMMSGRAILTRAIVHVEDVLADPEYPAQVGRAGGFRGVLAVPMLREGIPIGAIVVIRAQPGPFSTAQIELLKTFADQAVIAIENVRLFKELEVRNRDLTEALEQQTATSEILQVISQSPTDVQPVFDAIAREAMRLCTASYGVVGRYDGQMLHLAAHEHVRPEGVEAMRRLFPTRPSRATTSSRAILERAVVHVADALADPDYDKSVASGLQNRSVLAVPMLRNGEPIGTISVGRLEPQPFSDTQIALLQTFADQAVIAIENVRLFKELEERTQELTRSVEELRALGEVGQAVSGSLDIQSVLTSIVSHAVALSKSDAGTIYEFDESTQSFVPRANYGMSEDLIEALRQSHIRVGEGAVGQAARTGAAFQIADLEREPHYALRFLIEAGYRALLAVPLLREGRVIGGLVVRRKVAGTFPKSIVDLLQTFATQSVIAIQNARLFREIDEKSRALEELSRNQEQLSRLSTALQEPLSLSEQLTRVLDAARQVVGLDHLYIWTPSPVADGFMVSAGAGLGESDWRDLVGVTIPRGEAGALEAVYRDGEPLLFSETHPVPEKYRLRPPYSAIAALRLKAFLVSPMIARGRTVGVLSADNRVSRVPILPHTVDLLHTFAAQAAVAVENARLFQEIQEKSQQLELASKHKSQFLANMSHELRTPMNAVLGYTDLILDDIFGDVPPPIRETLERIKTNGQHLLALINDVLDLSRMEAGQLTLSLGDYAMGEVVHAVVSAVESLAAGKKLAFKAIVPADLPRGRGDERRLTQVLLNLAGNAIKFTDAGEVTIEARLAAGAILVSVSDTGPGISEADQQKIFEEFQQADSSSTRKKGGSGLGLSISRRIVELHGGRLWVESALGEGSTFYFTVPLWVERPAERA